MRKAILSLAVLALTACGPTYVQPVSQVQSGGWSGDPCDQSYFDAMACQSAISLGGWYLNGVLVRHYYGGYGYDHYYQQNHIYVLHGGSVHSYGQSIRVVQSRPVQPASSVGSASKAYVPPSQRSPASSAGSKPYSPPSRPASSYSPPSRPSSSYSSPRRK